MVSTGDFKNGLNIEWDGKPFTVMWFQHHKPGKGGAVMRVKLKNIHTGAIFERTFKSGEEFKGITVEKRKMQYLYSDTNTFHFMDVQNYEQIELDKEMLGENAQFLKENMEIYTVILEDRVIGVELPLSVVLTVTYTEPGVKGDTVSRTFKDATLETGVKIKVPLFINIGDKIKVDTRTIAYVERV